MKLNIKDLEKATSGKLIINNHECLIENISIDSREYKENSLFIPIIGETHDGHKFLNSAYENGYRVFLCDNNHDFTKDDITLIKVEDTKKSLGDIAKYIRNKYDIEYIGVTGSVGKTTTRDMIYSVLSSKYKTLKNDKNYNNEIGVPKTLFNLDSKIEKAVIEMGMSVKGELDYLASIVKPSIAVISNIGMSHIENFENQEGIFNAKMEITNYFNKDSILIVNGDDKYLKILKTKNLNYKVLTYGLDKSNDLYAYDIKLNIDKSSFKTIINNNEEEFTINVPAEHNVLNALSAILVGLNSNMTVEEIRKGLESLELTSGRLTVIKKKDFTIIDDSYNASCDSMISALNVIKKYTNRKICVLGDILETGKYDEELHRKVGKNITNDIDLLVTVGKSSLYIEDEAIKNGYINKKLHFENYEELIKNIDKILIKDSVILFKSSHGIHLDLVVKHVLENYEN